MSKIRYQAWTPASTLKNPNRKVHLLAIGEGSVLCGRRIAAHGGEPAWERVARFSRPDLCRRCFVVYREERERRAR